MRRKTTVIEAVRRGWISLDELTRRYSLSIDEFVAWERSESTMFLVHEPLDFKFYRHGERAPAMRAVLL